MTRHTDPYATHRTCIVGHTVPRAHRPDCDTEDCPGCRPAMAAPGMQVCAWHEQRVRDGLRDLPGLWADLGDTRRAKGAQRGAGGFSAPLPLDDDRRQARSAIRALLVAWCIVLADDRDLHLPPDTVRGMAHHVAVHAGWLLDSEHADQLCEDITSATATAWRLARPASGRTVRVPCPDCGERVPLDPHADDPEQVYECRGCGAWGVLAWWQARLVADVAPMPERQMIDWLKDQHRVRIADGTLRQWAKRGRVLTSIDPAHGCLLYDPLTAAVAALERHERAGA